MIALSAFVVEALESRKRDPVRMELSEAAGVIFASDVGTLRDADNLAGQWRRIREALGFGWVASHTFRKSVATRLDEAGLSVRITADMLGHRRISTTTDIYQARRRVHKVAADALALPRVDIGGE